MKAMTVKQRLEYVTLQMNLRGTEYGFFVFQLSSDEDWKQTFAEAFYSLLPKTSKLDIAVGYVSADSLIELQKLSN